MVATKIEYGDSGKVAREKINGIIDEVNASIPSIWDNGNWYIWGVDTGIRAKGVAVKEGENLIKEENDEIYTNLQFANNLTPTSVFPIWVTVGLVSTTNGRPYNGVLLNAKTSNTYARRLHAEEGLFFDSWLWVFKRIPTQIDIDSAVDTLRSELHTVAFSGKSSDLDNDAGFNSVPVLTWEEYSEIPGTAGDDKRYHIYTEVVQ